MATKYASNRHIAYTGHTTGFNSELRSASIIARNEALSDRDDYRKKRQNISHCAKTWCMHHVIYTFRLLRDEKPWPRSEQMTLAEASKRNREEWKKAMDRKPDATGRNILWRWSMEKGQRELSYKVSGAVVNAWFEHPRVDHEEFMADLKKAAERAGAPGIVEDHTNA
jgi:hypothetical protein